MGKEMTKFIQNISWVSIGTLGGAIFFFITNLTAGRLLSPTEYGKYSLVISIGQIFIIPMMLGISTASIKYISSTKNKQKKSSFAKNTVFLSILLTFFTSVTYLVFYSQISKLFRIDNKIFVFALIYSISLSFKYISEAIIKGFQKFKLLSLLEFINSFSVFIFFFAYIFLFKISNFQGYIIPIIIGLLLYIIIFLNKNYQVITPIKTNKNIIKTILNYGKYATLGAISGIAIGNIDKLVLNKYMSLADVGTYSIYLSSATFIGNYILQIFVQIFFPTISSIKEKTKVIPKIFKLITISFFPIITTNICSTSFILYLMGNKYEINLLYIFLFSLLGTLIIFSGILWWLIASFGIKGIRFTSVVGIILGLTNIIMLSSLTKFFGLLGTTYALIITNILIIYIAKLKITSYTNENK